MPTPRASLVPAATSVIEILESRIAPAALANYNLTDLTGPTGFKLSGVAINDYAGRAVSDAGDVNGDGFHDVLIGAYRADPNGNSASGASYVVFGHAGAFAGNLNLSTLNGSTGFKLSGVAQDDFSGLR